MPSANVKKAELDTNGFGPFGRAPHSGRAERHGLRAVSLRVAVGAALALAALVSCGDDGDGGTEMEDTEGLAMCCEIGSVCHLTADDPIGGPKQMCHSLGHENDPAACRAQYDNCLEVCGAEPMEMAHGCL